MWYSQYVTFFCDDYWRPLDVSRVYNLTLVVSSWLMDMAEIDIADGNFLKLKELQRVIQVEEGVEVSIDETLARILAFYRKFVPYN